MGATVAMSAEVKSLHEEAIASHRKRRSTAEDRAAKNTGIQTDHKRETADRQKLRKELSELVKAVTEFVQDAESNLSQHPAASVFGALLIGILVGRLLGRQ